MKALETDVKINLETAFFFFFSSQGSENVPLCAIVLVLDVFFFKVMLFLNYKGLHSLLFLFKNSTAFSHPFCFLCLGCLSRANYLWEDIIYLETLQYKLDWVIVTLGDSLSPLEGKIGQCSPATASYWKTVDFWPDKQFSFG